MMDKLKGLFRNAAGQAQQKFARRNGHANDFIKAVARGEATILDRFGAALGAGDKVLYHAGFDLVGDVVAVTPVLDPTVQPGTMSITMTFTVPIMAPARQPYGAIIQIMSAAMQQQMAAQQQEQAEPSEKPSGLVDVGGKPV